MTKANKRINVNNNAFFGYGWGWGWGWNPWWGGVPNSTITTSTQGVLFIDLIDAKQSLVNAP